MTRLICFFSIFLTIHSAITSEEQNQEYENGLLKNGSLVGNLESVHTGVIKIECKIPFWNCDNFTEKLGNLESLNHHPQTIKQEEKHENGFNIPRTNQLSGKENATKVSKSTTSKMQSFQNISNLNTSYENINELENLDEHDVLAEMLNSQMSCVTLVNNDVKFRLLSKTIDQRKLYKKCNNPKNNGIYDLLPVFHKKFGIHYRNIYCTGENYEPEMLRFWDVIITENCFLSEIRHVKGASYIDFLNRIVRSNSCSVTLLPPTDVNASEVRVNQMGNTCSLPLQQACESIGLQNKSSLSHLCQLCSWKKNACMCGDGCLWNQENEYLQLASPAINGIFISVGESLCMKINCYKAKCKPWQLGQASECLEVIEKLSGKILTLWVKTVFNLHNISGEMYGILQNSLRELLQNANETVFIKITRVTRLSEKKSSDCHILKVLLYTWSFLPRGKVQFIQKHFRASVSDAIKLHWNGTSSPSVIVSDMELRCNPDITGSFSKALPGNDSLLYTLIGISFAVTVSCVLVAAVINWIQKLCSVGSVTLRLKTVSTQ